MNCDVFISYRRDGGDMTAMYIYQALKERGYNVFYDLEVLRAGKFNEALLEAIDSCTDFVLILSPHALDRCRDDGDWVRREIAEALKKKKNIVPVMLNGFQFPEELPEDIEDVRFQNGLSATTEYFTESMDRLCSRYLTSRPVSVEKDESASASRGKGGRKGPLIGGILGAAAALAAIVLAVSGALKGKEPPAAPPEAAPAASETAAPEISAAPAATEAPEAQAETQAPAVDAADSAGTAQALKDMDLPVLRWEDQGTTDASLLPSRPAMGGPLARSEIDRIVVTDGEPGADAWDVSEAGDGSIRAWIETEGEQNTLLISAGGPIRMPQTVNGMFQGYTRAESIEWNGLVDFSRTENATNLFSDIGITLLDLGGMDFSSLRMADGMFQNCHALKTLNLTGARMDHLTDTTAMFDGCELLEQLDLSGLDTSRVQSMTDMFHACRSLRSLDLSGFHTGRATRMNSLFDGCERLESLNLEGWDTSRVTTMEAMFAFCGKLENLDVSQFRTESAETMRNMFLGCSSLLTLDVSGFDTRRVEEFSGMFDGCVLLDGLDIRGWDTSSAQNMQFMFQGCQSLTSLDVSGLKTSSVRDMCAMFLGMEQAEELDVSHFDTGSVRIFSNMFTECRRLKKLDVSGFALDSAEEMAGMFSGCVELTDIGMDPAHFGKGNTEGMYAGTVWDPEKP